MWFVTLKPSAPIGFLWALTKLGKVIKKRKTSSGALSDREILALNSTAGNGTGMAKAKLKGLYHRNWEKFHAIRRIEWETVGSWLAPAKGEKILDAGCGAGYFARFLSLKGCLVHGIDLSVNAINTAAKYNKEPSAFFSRGDVLELPYSTSAFDKAVSVCCLEHFTNDEKALQELNRILIDNGRLVLSVDAYNSRFTAEGFRKKCATAFSIERFYDAATIRNKLHKAGFSCLRHQYLFHSKASSALFRLVFYYEKLRYFFLAAFPLLYTASKVSDSFARNKDEGFILVVEAEKERDL
jgi:SAM-dependent methyltransferase